MYLSTVLFLDYDKNKMTDNNSIKKNWWNDLLKGNRNNKVEYYELVEHLDKILQLRQQAEKTEIINFLTKEATAFSNGYAIAFAVLEKYATEDIVDLIFQSAKSIDLNDQRIIYPLKVLGKKGDQKHRQLLESFLLSNKLNENHSFVHWSTYPKFPDLFAKAYSKYLIETDYKEWTGSAVVQSFMTNAKALELLKKYLEKKNNNVWQNLKNDLQIELTKDLWDKANKTEIERLISADNRTTTKAGRSWLQKLFSSQ